MNETEYGKITSVEYGYCGYQDAMLGLKLTLEGQGWGVGADKPGGWTTDPSPSAEWTKEDRIKSLGENAMFILQLLKDAKVNCVSELKGKPVVCTFVNMKLVSWRIFKEVL